MANLSATQIGQYASNAGFRGNALIMSIAIALAESGGNPSVVNSAGDVGLWQINQPLHPQYSTSWLLNPANNAQAAFTLSASGGNWRPWCTAYSDGACGTRGGTFLGSGSPYQKFMPQAQSAVLGNINVGSTPSPSQQLFSPAYLKDMVAWMKDPSIPMYGRWNHAAQAEGGVDLTSPGGTPVYALGTGPIIGNGDFWHSSSVYTPGSGNPGYGVVTQRINVPGYGVNDLYYQHIDRNIAVVGPTCYANQCGNRILSRGQIVGWVRSNVGEIEMGFNADWGGVWGVSHPKPWVTDPRPMIAALMTGGGSPTGINIGTPSTPMLNTYVPLTDQVHETLINTPGFYGIALALDEAEKFPGYIDLTQPASIDTPVGSIGVPDVNGIVRSVGATISDNFLPWIIRSSLVVLGMTLIAALMIKLTEPVAVPLVKGVVGLI